MLPTIHSEHLRSRMCQLWRQDPPSPSGRLYRAQSAPVIGVCTTCDLGPKAREVESGAEKCGAPIPLGTVGRGGESQQNKGPPTPPSFILFHTFLILKLLWKNRPAFSHKSLSSLSYGLSGRIQPVMDFPGALALVGDEKGKEGRCLSVRSLARCPACGELDVSCWTWVGPWLLAISVAFFFFF